MVPAVSPLEPWERPRLTSDPYPRRGSADPVATSAAATDEDRISAFLQLGYLPRPDLAASTAEGLSAAMANHAEPSAHASESDRLSRGRRVLEASIRVTGTGEHVLPLSAGLDSRVVLAVLRRQVDCSRITAVTFGVPRTWDYEISPRIARRAGIRHERIDLSRVPVDADQLLRTARLGSSWTFLLDAFYNRVLAERCPETSTIWSGFLGDALSGGHLPKTPSRSWDDAVANFVARGPGKSHPTMIGCGNIARLLPSGPHPRLGNVTLDDQLDLLVRQPSYIRRVILFAGHQYRLPFESPQVTRFFLGLDFADRHRQRLYRKLVLDLAPDLADLPTTTNLGLRLQAPSWRRKLQSHRLHLLAVLRSRFPGVPWSKYPGTNYVDLDAAFRVRKDFRELGGDCLHELRTRGAVDWIDLPRLWSEHQSGRIRVGNLLVLLCAIEMSLRAEAETRDPSREPRHSRKAEA